MKPPNYNENVFINCPFDRKYNPLFNAIIFTIHSLGLRPRCTKEITGTRNRLNKIIELIKSSKYGIHDISRVELDEGLPRFNMPFELGLDLGCKESGSAFKDKQLLVLDSEEHRYLKCISDLGGHDPQIHHNKVKEVIQVVCDWLRQNVKNPELLPNPKQISNDYKEFIKDLPTIRKQFPEKPAFMDFSHIIAEWLNKRPKL